MTLRGDKRLASSQRRFGTDSYGQCLSTATRGEVVGITHLAPFVTATTNTGALLFSMASLIIIIIIIIMQLYSAFRSGDTAAHVSFSVSY